MKRSAGAIALLVLALMMLAPSLAYAVSVTWPITVSAPSNVSLDNTIFAGTQINTPNGGDTIISNITGCTGPSDCTLGSGGDNARLKVVAAGAGLNGSGVCTNPITPGCPGGWTNSANGGPRRGPFLMTNGTQAADHIYNFTLNGAAFQLTAPPAPSVTGAVTVSAGGNIQNAINGAGGGVPIFLNCGSYSSGFSANGHNVVSATPMKQINGQTCRAVIHGSIDISGGIVYGVSITNCSNPCITGSNGTLTNSIVDAQAGGSPTTQWICQSGGITLNWDTLLNGRMEGNCGGATPFTMDRLYIHHCSDDCNGGSYGGGGEFRFTNSFCDVDNTTDRSMGNLGACMEYGDAGAKMTILNNYELNGGGGPSPDCCGGYAWSLIGEAPNQEFRYNYNAGHQTITETSTHQSIRSDSTLIATDNYYDFQNIQNFGTYSGLGNGGNPAQGMGDTSPTCPEGNSITYARNRGVPQLNDFCIGNYSAGPTQNVGIPAPFTAGAGS